MQQVISLDSTKQSVRTKQQQPELTSMPQRKQTNKPELEQKKFEQEKCRRRGFAARPRPFLLYIQTPDYTYKKFQVVAETYFSLFREKPLPAFLYFRRVLLPSYPPLPAFRGPPCPRVRPAAHCFWSGPSRGPDPARRRDSDVPE